MASSSSPGRASQSCASASHPPACRPAHGLLAGAMEPVDLEALKCILRKLNSDNQAHVWDYAQYLLWLQKSQEKTEKSRGN